MMTLTEVLNMFRNGATVGEVFKSAASKEAPWEAERQTSNVVSFGHARAGIELGDKVRDDVTSFAGTVTGIADYFTGCSQALIQPPCAAAGTFQEGRWFDVDRLSITEKKAVVHIVKTARGGPAGSAPVK